MAEYIPHKDGTADEHVTSFKGKLGVIGLAKLVSSRVVSEEVLAGTEIPGGGGYYT